MVVSFVFYLRLYFCFYSITLPPHFHTKVIQTFIKPAGTMDTELFGKLYGSDTACPVIKKSAYFIFFKILFYFFISCIIKHVTSFVWSF